MYIEPYTTLDASHGFVDVCSKKYTASKAKRT